MAVTVEKRPIGVVLDPTGISATINSDYSSAFATVNSTSHGLSDGAYVYIKSNVENYNGFWIIDVQNANEFLLRDAPYVAWIVDASITYYNQETTHGWSCVHLPIVYELHNTRYPVNSIDTVRTISSISNENGYAQLSLSGSLGTFEDLSFVIISNAPNSDFNGVYQIMDKLSTSSVIMNLDYLSTPASGLVGASIQLYYSNYNFVVRVYAGINTSHEWADQKPYALAATLNIIPDENNSAKFSINEILKSYVNSENNLTLATLPNNIDAWTNFYIEVAEQYDTSNGYSITTTRSGYVSDQATFEGTAVNAKLAFKNVHSGYLSDYIMINSTSKFLTLFAIPVLFACSDDLPDCYNEVSFLKSSNEDVNLVSTWYANNVSQDTTTQTISGDQGLYRVPITASCSYDRVDIKLEPIDFILSTADIAALPEQQGVDEVQWVASTAYSILTFTGAPPLLIISSLKYKSIYANGLVTVIVNWEHDVPSGAINGSSLVIYLLDQNFNTIDSYDISMGAGMSSDLTQIDFNINQTAYYVAFDHIATSVFAGQSRVLVDQLEVQYSTSSETKQFEINCGCANQEVRISWLNNLGAFESPWAFTGETEHTVDITESGETTQNIFPSWPNSYGEFADTIDKQTYRKSYNRKFIFSQFLTQDQADAISFIKSSPLVQIVNSRTDRRTVIVDTDSFTKYKDGDKTYTVQFNILYTDEIPSQTI